MLNLTYLDKRIDLLEKRKEEIVSSLKKLGIQIGANDQAQKTFLNDFKLDINRLKDLRVACIMDEFTLNSYLPECNLLELTPEGWRQEIDQFMPHLIFIESAWQGKDKLWYRKIANGSKEYFEMTSYCQEKHIPIIFWNKEDPVYTDTFMIAARMADVVFTTDIDCIKKYKSTLKHDRVYHLHFAAQPQIHNPIEKYDRKDKYCFAGAYYHKYVKRCKVFDDFADFFINTKGLDIYDRNYKNALPEHAFPEKYNDYILGRLEPEEIDIAYKGYNFGINMNSVDQSQTMFARRVFEMLASNTVTIGNYSRGVKNFFGDLTLCTNDGQTLKQNIKSWCQNEASFRKYRLLGLRSVLSQHLYEDRLGYIVEKVFHKNIKRALPVIHVFCKATTQEEIDYAIYSFKKQTYAYKKLYIIGGQEEVENEKDIMFLTNEEGSKKVDNLVEAGSYVTVFDVKHYYGKQYLMDLALNTRYGEFQGVGKVNYYGNTDGKISIDKTSDTYKKVEALRLDRAIIKCECLKEQTIEEILESKVTIDDLFAIDEFNFCENLVAAQCDTVDDLVIADQGISMKEIETIAESIKTNQFASEGVSICVDDLLACMKNNVAAPVQFSKVANTIHIQSKLNEDKNYYINVERWFNVNDFIEDNHLNFIFNGVGSLDNLGTCIFYNESKEKLSAVFTKFNRLFNAEVPENARYFKLNFRIKGSGEFKINDVTIGATKLPEQKVCFLSRSNVLVLSNQYPSQEALYRNMFVHKRMTAYKEDGFTYDVMKMNIYAKDEYREFEGINVIEGQGDVLANILETGHIDTVCVHFLDRQMWEVLKCFKDKIRIIVWVHGAEIQPWWRREYNYTTEQELEKAKVDSNVRMAFWAEVFKEINEYNIHFVFVSQYFADEIFEDNKVQLDKEKYTIIHNCIDTNMFTYEEKNAEQRKKFLSIRPYASNKYANDLTVKAILELAKKPYFDDMEFRLIGSGELFEETLKPLRKYKNVSIEKTFLRQEDIAKLHKEYGVFITPTRMDAQGVSRDEAMSSGLVPVTNAVTAIPEFVDDECGVLVLGEDYKAMAEGIDRLYNDAEYFCKLSKNAADRVRQQTSKEYTIDKEISLINQ